MSGYKTIQRESILQILSSNTGKAFTVKGIAEAIRSEESILWDPSESTIYRIMNDLVKNEIVHKNVNSKREYLYTFVGNNNPQITVRCKICGKVQHIDEKVCCEIIDELKQNVSIGTDEDIEILGICDKCK